LSNITIIKEKSRLTESENTKLTRNQKISLIALNIFIIICFFGIILGILLKLYVFFGISLFGLFLSLITLWNLAMIEEFNLGFKGKLFLIVFNSNFALFLAGVLLQSEILIYLIYLTLILTAIIGIISLFIESKKIREKMKNEN
jgi:hypothetical protein